MCNKRALVMWLAEGEGPCLFKQKTTNPAYCSFKAFLPIFKINNFIHKVFFSLTVAPMLGSNI